MLNLGEQAPLADLSVLTAGYHTVARLSPSCIVYVHKRQDIVPLHPTSLIFCWYNFNMR